MVARNAAHLRQARASISGERVRELPGGLRFPFPRDVPFDISFEVSSQRGDCKNASLAVLAVGSTMRALRLPPAVIPLFLSSFSVRKGE